MFYKKMIRPLLFNLEPETAHRLTMLLAMGVQKTPGALELLHFVFSLNTNKSMKKTIFGKEFAHPFGLAAGLDKNVSYVPFFHALGFSFVEVGSVTHLPSPGNASPRLFRLKEDEALINRMGLNNVGALEVLDSISKKKNPCPVGLNIAKTHSPLILGSEGIKDVCSTYSLLHEHFDYVCLNVSCPNTAEGKTFEDLALLKELLFEIKKIRGQTPLVLKLSPDLEISHFEKIMELTQEFSLSGLVLGNTSQKRGELTDTPLKNERGGLSGPQLFKASYDLLLRARKVLPSDFTLIACGGINSEERAKKCLDAGADLIELYTGLIYEGPGLIRRLRKL